MQYTLLFRVIFSLLLFVSAVLLFNFVLEQDQNYGQFDWLESPNDSPFYGLFGVACGTLLWLLTRNLVIGNEASKELVRVSVNWAITIAWLINLMLLGLLLFEHPLAPIENVYKVEVLKINTPSGQSKPIEHDLTVRSWRRNGVETLRTKDYIEANSLLKVGVARVAIGEDWLGRIRVLHVKQIYAEK